MIRRLAHLSRAALAVLPAALCLGGCVSITIPGNVTTAIFLVPIMLDDGARMNGAGANDGGWLGNADSHPAVRPRSGDTGPADGTQVQVR
ncbi:MAG TPA: hypothetical protein VGN52_23080 [Burkholderiales bacterium]|jgi:hypothetical protein